MLYYYIRHLEVIMVRKEGAGTKRCYSLELDIEGGLDGCGEHGDRVWCDEVEILIISLQSRRRLCCTLLGLCSLSNTYNSLTGNVQACRRPWVSWKAC